MISLKKIDPRKELPIPIGKYIQKNFAGAAIKQAWTPVFDEGGDEGGGGGNEGDPETEPINPIPPGGGSGGKEPGSPGSPPSGPGGDSGGGGGHGGGGGDGDREKPPKPGGFDPGGVRFPPKSNLNLNTIFVQVFKNSETWNLTFTKNGQLLKKEVSKP